MEMMMQELDFKKPTMVPIYEQIAATIKKNITSGLLHDGVKLPPEPELALQFGISRPTLRKSLKRLEEQNLINQRKGCGTFVSYRNVAKKRIALIVGTDIHKVYDPYTFRILSGLNFSLQVKSHNEILFLDNSTDCSILNKFHASECDGIICMNDSDSAVDELLKPEFSNIPMVFLNNRKTLMEEFSYACVTSNPRAIEIAVAHLSELGHREVAYIAASPRFSDLKLRNEEFLEVRAQYGLSEDSSLFLEYNNPTMPWYNQARDITRELCSRQNRPSAIICPNACNAYGAWQGIMDCKLRIPEDISIIGFDCESYFNPHLSTMSQPIVEMAEATGDLMIDMLNKNKLIQKNLVFDVKLEERGSCSPHKK